MFRLLNSHHYPNPQKRGEGTFKRGKKAGRECNRPYSISMLFREFHDPDLDLNLSYHNFANNHSPNFTSPSIQAIIMKKCLKKDD